MESIYGVARAEAWGRRHHSVVSARQAFASGVPRQLAQQVVADGRWVRLLRGIYWTAPAGRPSTPTLLYAALLFAGVGVEPMGTVVGRSAARLHGLLEDQDPWRPEILLPSSLHRRQPRGICYVGAELGPADTMTVAGLPVTTPERTFRDLARVATYDDLLVAGDAALRREVLPAAALRGLAMSSPALRPLADAEPGAESVFESRVRAEILRAGLPRPVLQHEVWRDGAFVGRIDLAWPAWRLGLEADGAQSHASARALAADLRRQNALLAAGYQLVRVVWADLGTIGAQVRAHLARVSHGAA